jgi:toxin FitB
VNVVDSSAWLAYVAGTANADAFAPAIEQSERLLVPVITIYEVYKRLRAQRSENDALAVVAQMRLGRIVPLDEAIALRAADLSLTHGLPMADSIILATARYWDAVVWTQDADFEGLDGVRYFPG